MLNTCSYDAMWRVAGRQLSGGNSVVVDCPLARQQLYDDGCRVAAQVGACECNHAWPTFAARAQAHASVQHGANVAVVETELQPAVWRRRLELRSATQEASCGHKPASWEQLETLVKGYNGCHEWPKDAQPQHYLVLDTTSESSTVLQSRTFQFLAEKGLI